MFRRLAMVSERFAWLVLAGWVGLAVLLMVTAPSLQDVGTQDTTSFLPKNSPSQHADLVLQRQFPDDPTRESAIVVLSRNTKLTEADHAYVTQVAAFLRSPAVRHVGQVQSVVDSPDLAAFLRAPDGGAELMVVGFDAPPFTDAVSRDIEALRGHLDRTAPAGLEHHVTGIAGLATDQMEGLKDSFNSTAIASVLLVLLILVFVYRSAVAPLVPLFTIGAAFLVSRGLIGLLADHGFKVSSQVETFMVVLIFGAGTDYCLFAVSRYKEELHGGDPLPQTLRRAMGLVGAVIAASAGTVIVGFASQVSARSGIYKSIGPSIALAIFVTLVASLTLTPALLKLAGRHAFWPASIDKVRNQGDTHSPRWERVAGVIRQQPAVVLLAGIILLQIPAAAMGWFHESFDLVKDLPTNADARQGFDALSRHYPGGTLSPVYLVVTANGPITDDARLAAIDKLSDDLRREPGVAEVRSVTQPAGAPITLQTAQRLGLGGADGGAFGLDPNTVDISALVNAISSPEGLRFTGPVLRAYPQIKDRLGFLLGRDGKTTRLVIALKGNPYENRALDAFRQIDDAANHSLAGSALTDARIAVGGPTSFYVDLRQAGSQDFRLIVAVLLGGIFVVLAVLLRSLIAPFYLLATVVLSYLATMGITVAVFQGIGNSEGVSFWLPPFLFVILVALGADYNIFIMSRIREEAEAGHEIHEAAARGLVFTGHVITSAGLILAGTFAALMLAPLPNMRQIGFAVTLGVLIDTFIVRSLLVPSATMLLGRWAFWPSTIGRGARVVERRHLGVAGAAIAAFAAVLVLMATSGGADDPIVRVAATAPPASHGGTAVAGEHVTTPSTTAVAPGSTTTAPPPPTGRADASRSAGGSAPSSSPPATQSPSGPTRIAVPASGGWRYHVEGTRKVGAAGSAQPFSEDVVTQVSKTGGSADAPEMKVAAQSGSGSEEQTRRYGTAAVELIALKQSSNGASFGGTMSPPQTLARWPMKVGDTWAGDWSTGQVSGRSTAKVTGIRDVNVAGRSYRCYQVQTDSTFSGQAQGEQHETACWVAELGMSADTTSQYSGTYSGFAFDLRQHAVLTGTP